MQALLLITVVIATSSIYSYAEDLAPQASQYPFEYGIRDPQAGELRPHLEQKGGQQIGVYALIDSGGTKLVQKISQPQYPAPFGEAYPFAYGKDIPVTQGYPYGYGYGYGFGAPVPPTFLGAPQWKTPGFGGDELLGIGPWGNKGYGGYPLEVAGQWPNKAYGGGPFEGPSFWPNRVYGGNPLEVAGPWPKVYGRNSLEVPGQWPFKGYGGYLDC